MKNSPFLKFIQCVVLCLLAFAIVPERIFAQEAVACMKDDSGNITEYYYTIPDAMNGSRKGAIHMLTDWDLGAQINIVEGTTSIIYMDGFTIKKSNGKQSDQYEGGIFTIHPNAKLFLYGSTTSKEFTDSKGNKVTSGGLVTGGYGLDGGAINMKDAAKLYLTNVAISGNSSEYRGGGIYIAKEDVEIWMDNAHIDHNWAGTSGGGIFSNVDGTHIHMNNHSTINYNQGNKTGSNGGGICFQKSWFSVEGDGTSEISYNSVIPGQYGDGTSGGGIFVNEKKFATNYGIISGITIKGNYAGQGGGIEIGPRNFTLKDVTITDNKAIIRGGGVFVIYDVDINLSGDVKVYNNHRTNGTDDDIFLSTGFGHNAYIKLNNLNEKSLIGIRTETTGDRLVVRNISGSELISCFFLNHASSYHIGYQAGDNELWQRSGATTYTVKVNGQPVGKYAEGTKNVTIVDNNTDTSRVFVSWKENHLVKLTSDQLKSKSISFVMPAANVNMEANYLPVASNIRLNMDSLTQGQALPLEATLTWNFDNKEGKEEVSLNWYKKVNGTYINCNGEDATYGNEYIFEVCANATQDGVHVLSSIITKEDIKINCEGRDITLSELSLSDEGTLNFKSNKILVGKDVIAYVDPIVVSVREGDSKGTVVKAMNSSLNVIATSNNEYEYEVKGHVTDKGDLDSTTWFNEEGIIKPESSYFEKTIELTNYNTNIDLNGITSTKLIVMVLPKDNDNVFRINDSDITVDGDYWYKNIKIEGEYYILNNESKLNDNNNTVVLTGKKGERKEYELIVIDWNGNETMDKTYVLDDSKPATPTLLDGASGKNDNGDLYQQITTNYNLVDYPNTKVYLLYNKNGDSNWIIEPYLSTEVSTESNTSKKVKAFAFVVDENNDMSALASRTYLLDNTIKFSLDQSFISKVDVTIDDIVYGKALPTDINKIDVTLSENETVSYENAPILSWNTNGEDTALNNKAYQAKVELKTTEKYTADYLSSLHVVVNNDDRIYAYIENEDNKAMLYIIFPELESSTGGYDDDAQLSYILSSIEVGDYVKEISYDEAVALNNDFEYFYLPNVVLKVGNNEKDSIYADVTYSVVTAFDANNHNDQEIVLEGTIRKPSYINFNGLSDKITLKIKVKGTGSNSSSLTCEEYMKSNDWTWSETKQKCVYRVSNTSVQ